MTRDVLVTGCSSGLGRAIAVHLSSRGWRVHATAREDSDLADLEHLGFEPVALELGSSDSIGAAVESVLARSGGKLDALVNNAGFSQLGATEDITRAELRTQFETNVFGTFELTNLVLPHLLAQGTGKLIFVSSVCGRVAIPYLGSYSASKAALEALVDALRRELRDTRIGVHIVEPGIFNTGCFSATTRHFETVSRSRNSRHAERCRSVLSQFERELASIPTERSVLVANAVDDFLAGRRRSARCIVPGRARVYELARRFLPDSLLDAALSWRRGGL